MLTPMEEEALDTLLMVRDMHNTPKIGKGDRNYVLGCLRAIIVKLTNKKFGCPSGRHAGSVGCHCNERGFTLIELTIVVCIIAVLAAVLVPKMGNAIRRSKEATTKANLGILRSAIGVYYANHEGKYPSDNLQSLIDENILSGIPYERTPPYHPGGNVVGAGSTAAWGANPGNWYYFNVFGEERYGQIVVNCNHTDLNGVEWYAN